MNTDKIKSIRRHGKAARGQRELVKHLEGESGRHFLQTKDKVGYGYSLDANEFTRILNGSSPFIAFCGRSV